MFGISAQRTTVETNQGNVVQAAKKCAYSNTNQLSNDIGKTDILPFLSL